LYNESGKVSPRNKITINALKLEVVFREVVLC
jgi:hypothetical protein